MRLLMFSTAIVCVLSFPAQADSLGAALCKHYAGHVDIEGKFGGTRNIGETSVFLPIACSGETLLFSDIRFKGDNVRNRELNIAIGARQLKENGILGGYLYLDRRESGFTNKMHSQITAGAEWLAETYEARFNGYIPVTGDKTAVKTLGQPLSSTPILAGTGILVQSGAQQIINEEPLWGADVEAGFKIPDTKLWLFAGGFTFNGEESESLTGARTRVHYDLNDYVSLSAEGQYDDVRGRMGWLGVRFSIPFGGPAEKPEGLKARMTASPVRDVDIVTIPKVVAVEEGEYIPVTNATTGATQRVLYVDNTAAGGGDGSKENPYNTLTAAQAALQDYDTLYVHTGVGTAGQDQGFIINKRGVQMIGAGTAFVFDGSKFTAGNNTNINGTVLIAAGAAPTITNTQVYDGIDSESGAGIMIKASDTVLAGVTVQGAQGSGIYAHADGEDLENISIYNTQSNNNLRHGYVVQSRDFGTMTDVNLSTSSADLNTLNGIIVQSQTNGYIDDLTLDGFDSTNNGERGIHIQATSGATAGTINLSDITSSDNTSYGFLLQTSDSSSSIDEVIVRGTTFHSNDLPGFYTQMSGGLIGTIDIDDITTTSNTGAGIHFIPGSGGQIDSITINDAHSSGNTTNGIAFQGNTSGGVIGDARVTNSTVTGNTQNGIVFITNNTVNPNLSSVQGSVENTKITNNGRDGIAVNHDSTLGSINIDLGGGVRSDGGNSIYGNGTSNTTTYRDIKLDTNAGPAIPAQNNWWGQPGGPLGTQIVNEGGAPNTGTADTSSPLGADPLP